LFDDIDNSLPRRAGLATKAGCELISLCLYVSVVIDLSAIINHRDTEAQRKAARWRSRQTRRAVRIGHVPTRPERPL